MYYSLSVDLTTLDTEIEKISKLGSWWYSDENTHISIIYPLYCNIDEKLGFENELCVKSHKKLQITKPIYSVAWPFHFIPLSTFLHGYTEGKQNT